MTIREIIATVEVLGSKAETESEKTVLRECWSKLKGFERVLEMDGRAKAKRRN